MFEVISRAPPWAVWSGEKGGELCLRATACPATPGTGRPPAPLPGEKYKLPSSIPLLTCEAERVTQRTGLRGREGMAAYRWQVWKKKKGGKDVSQAHLKDGVQLVEAFKASHSLASTAGESVMSG